MLDDDTSRLRLLTVALRAWPGLRRLLAKEQEQALGDGFDVRRYHDELHGHGPLPPDILEPRMRAWIRRPR